MTWWKDIADIVASVVTTAAVLAGGLWTYLLFVRQRLRFPRLVIAMNVQEELLSDRCRLVHVAVALQNTGAVLLQAPSAELRLRQVSPVENDLRQTVLSGLDPVVTGSSEVSWPMVAGREWKWQPQALEIEPGESDVLHSDFVIDSSISVIELYFFMDNPSKRRDGLGWTEKRLHRVQSQGEH
jgi:hypothetical protein